MSNKPCPTQIVKKLLISTQVIKFPVIKCKRWRFLTIWVGHILLNTLYLFYSFLTVCHIFFLCIHHSCFILIFLSLNMIGIFWQQICSKITLIRSYFLLNDYFSGLGEHSYNTLNVWCIRLQTAVFSSSRKCHCAE